MTGKKTLLFVLLAFTLVSCFPANQTPEPTPPPATEVQGNMDTEQHISVVYIDSAGNIWLWQDVRERVQLTFSMDAVDVRISTDGVWIAYLTNSGEMWSIKADGTDLRRLVDTVYLENLIPFNGSGAEIYKFDFIPGTYQIFFQVFAVGDVSGVDLFKVNAEVGLITRVFAPGQGGNGNYFSPNGEWVVIAYPNELILTRVDGTEPEIVFSLPAMRGFSSCRGPEAVWQEDSSSFFIVVPEYQNDEYLGRESMYSVALDGSKEARLTFLSLPFIQSFIAPGGERLAYLIDDGEVVNLHLVSTTEAGETKDELYISEAGVGFFGWNPDGERFVIWRGNRKKPLIASLTSMPVPLINDASVSIESFEWVAENCFLYTITEMNMLGLYYLVPADPENNPKVMIGDNVRPGKYDFTGGCYLP